MKVPNHITFVFISYIEKHPGMNPKIFELNPEVKLYENKYVELLYNSYCSNTIEITGKIDLSEIFNYFLEFNA